VKRKVTKRKPICPHDQRKNWGDSLMYRCACGNVWTSGRFSGIVPQEQGAAAMYAAYSRGPAVR